MPESCKEEFGEKMEEKKFSYYEADRTEKYPMSKKTSEDGIPLLQEGAFNLFTSLPCPILSRFNREFQNYIEQYNKVQDIPIYSATLAGLDYDSFDNLLRFSEDINDMPDAIVSTGSNWQFRKNFRQHFIDNGLYQPYYPPHFADAMPKQLREVADRYRIGFLAFGSWDLLYDLSFGEDGPFPKRWFDLSRPEFEGKIAMHSCGDCGPGCTSLLQLLKDEGGSEALASFARNVQKLKHFAEILKGIDSGKADSAPFNIIPGPACAQIPSSKRVVLIEPRDGIIPLQVGILVKRDRMSEAEEALSFFYSDAFRKVLKKGSMVPVDELEPDSRFVLPDWDTLLTGDPDEMEYLLQEEFMMYYTGEALVGTSCHA
jgi:ABC-type Fe3+ transport system substrate-binding protein